MPAVSRRSSGQSASSAPEEQGAARPDLVEHRLEPVGADDLPPTPGSALRASTLPPELRELPLQLHRLYYHPAPFFPPGGPWLRRQAKRLVNATLRVFGRKQNEFNREFVETATLIMAEVRGLRRWLEEQGPLFDGIGAVHEKIASLERGLRHLREHLASLNQQVRAQGPNEAVTATIDRITAAHERLTSEMTQQQARHEELAGIVARQSDVSEWVALIERRVEGVALEMRELGESDRELPEPRIVDPEHFRRRVEAMGDGVRVNLGCGDRPWPDYVNVDLRQLRDVEILADARRLPFAPGTLAEVASAHLVEHFREYQLRTRILPYWKSLLRPRGCLRIICPNWAAMIERLHDGRMSLENFKLVTFGGQDYQGDDHFAMYSPDTLRNLLLDGGFSDIEVLAVDRMNGLCPEMEVVASVPRV